VADDGLNDVVVSDEVMRIESFEVSAVPLPSRRAMVTHEGVDPSAGAYVPVIVDLL